MLIIPATDVYFFFVDASLETGCLVSSCNRTVIHCLAVICDVSASFMATGYSHVADERDLVSRFRANFVVDGFNAMEERTWKRLCIGDQWFTVSVMCKAPHLSS